MEFKKFNLRFVRSTPNFYAKYVRLVLKALNLCKIYAKFNATYVRSMLQFNAKYVRFTPDFIAKYVRLALKALNLCKIYAKFNAKYVRSTLKFNIKYVRSTPNFNAKCVRLASNALNLCKIYAKFNAKYVISTLKFNAKYVRSTPKFNAKLCAKLCANAKFATQNVCKFGISFELGRVKFVFQKFLATLFIGVLFFFEGTSSLYTPPNYETPCVRDGECFFGYFCQAAPNGKCVRKHCTKTTDCPADFECTSDKRCTIKPPPTYDWK